MEEQQEPKGGLRFFRLLLPGFSSKLVLPNDLSKHFGRRETATLMSPDGQFWHVDCYKELRDVYLGGESWQKFILANHLNLENLLVFRYRGNMVFTFRAFDSSTKEIAYGSSSVMQDHEGVKQEEIIPDNVACSNSTPCKKRKSQEQPNSDQVRVSGKERFEVTIDAYDLSQQRCCLSIQSTSARMCGFLKGHNEVTLEDPCGREWSIGLFRCSQSQRVYLSKGWVEFARANGLKEGNRCLFELQSQQNTSKLMMSVKILNNAPYKKKSFSYGRTFETTISTSNLKHDYLHLPTGFMKSNGLTTCNELKLSYLKGQMWVVKVGYRYSPNWRAHFREGWRKFAVSNQLEEGDKCIFELLSDHKEKVLQVQILRCQELRGSGPSTKEMGLPRHFDLPPKHRFDASVITYTRRQSSGGTISGAGGSFAAKSAAGARDGLSAVAGSFLMPIAVPEDP